jgi:hypothetical protein
MSARLISETNTSAVERLIRSAFHCSDQNTSESFRAVFEHGQWWIVTLEPEGTEEDEKTFSVVDAEPGVKRYGIDFEQLG